MERVNQIGERGGSKMSFLITIVILGAMAFTAVKIVPIYVEKYQMQDAIENESRFAMSAYPKKSTEDVRDDVYKKAMELDVPVKREDIKVTVTNLGVDISMDYSVPINLAVTQWAPQFHLHANNQII